MNAKVHDVIAMLISDHREVSDMFKQFEALGERATADANGNKKMLVDALCAALSVHAQIEEEIFYPAVREAAKETDALMDEAEVEHASAKELVMQRQEMDPEDDLYDAKVKVLSEQIAHHVKEEEKEMFPKAKKAGLDLVALGQEMALRKDELIATR